MYISGGLIFLLTEGRLPQLKDAIDIHTRADPDGPAHVENSIPSQ